MLSIDVDGADYWLWRELDLFRPRIVVIEYNSVLGPTDSLVEPRDRRDTYDKAAYGGASIAALRALGKAKGYRLIHTEMTGNNAFFLREDQVGTYPSEDVVPIRAPNHFLLAEAHAPDSLHRPYEAPPPIQP
ncbi:MAG: hypothetical protein H0U16_02750 [Actinobacteria bacterium]|nr:hypothetical protein [Actinomycetota bacterium]